MAGIVRIAAASAVAALVAAGAATAQPINMVEARSLGQHMAVTAAMAERNAGVEGVQPSVRAAVQGVIISAAADPLVVLAAFDQLNLACGQGRSASGWSCPTSVEAMRAVASIRSIVLAQVEQTDPAALDTPGNAPIGSVPSTSAAGSNYRNL